MKGMKKLFFTVLVLFCMAAMPCVQAQAEEDMLLVYAQVPQDWEQPCLWAFADDGTNAFEAWPGSSMKPDENNPGWYYCFVPKEAGANVIVNANEGSVQTADCQTGSADTWLMIQDAENVEAVNEKMTQGDLPLYEAGVKVYVRVPEDWSMPCLWAWSAPDGTNAFPNWPGQELELTPDGWYTYEIPAWVNSVIVNGNLGEVQTTDLSVEPKDMWIMVADAENAEVLYEKPEVEEEMITVRAQVPGDWLLPCLWAWSAPDGTNVFPNWPGQELELSEDGWYTYQVPAWVNSVIINGNLGEVQTQDIGIEAKDVWIVVKDAETFEVAYEAPALSGEKTAGTDDGARAAGESDIPEESAPDGTGKEAQESSVFPIIVILAAVILAGGAAGWVLYKKKSDK